MEREERRVMEADGLLTVRELAGPVCETFDRPHHERPAVAGEVA